MNVKATSSIALAGNKFNNNNKCKLLKGKHPLKQYKFYLDIQSSQTSTKIEQLIKELGGNLEFFWTQEVTHFVTDKEIHENPSALNGTSAPQSNRSVNSNYSDGSINSPNVTNDFNKTTKPRSHSRANAMLHKARRETNDINATQQDRITSKAKELGTVIWHTNYTLKFLKKLIAELALISKEKNNNTHNNNNNSLVNSLNSSRDTVELKEPFIKIESVERSYRPFYKELQKSDFSILKIRNQKEKGGAGDHKKMTRKSRSSSKHRPQNHVNIKTSSKVVSSSEKQCGYCELCKVEYDVLKTHLKTDEHCCFVKNHQNFLVLDTLIKNGANVNKFLNRDLSEQYSPTKQENKISPLKSPRQLRQTATRLSKSAINRTSDNDVMNVSVASPAIEKVKKQICKDSPPIRHTLQNSMLYKVVGDGENTKANDAVNHVVSTTKPNKMETRNRGTTGEGGGGGGGDGPIIVKFRKIRQSELTLLNGEAVNFMFPKKRRGSTDMTDMDRHTTSDNSRLSCSSFSLSTSEADHDSSFHAQNKRRKHGADNLNLTNNKASACNKTTDDNLEDSSLIGKRTTVTTTTTRTSSPPTLRKSRTSTAASLRSPPVSAIRTRRQCVTGIYKELDEEEILLMDELLLLEDVSQPPPSVDKQRRTRAKSVAPRLMRDEARTDCANRAEEWRKELKVKKKPPLPTVQPKIPSLLEASDKLKESFFAFERVPKSEQWYKVFQRQDNCQQRVFEYYGNTDYRKLPYELGAQSMREAKFPCFLCPKKEAPVIKKEKTPPPVVVAPPPIAAKVIKSEKTVTAEAKIVPKEKDSKKSSRPKPKAIFKKAWLFETPRKSPRVHASTLAILSCLLRQQEKEDRTTISSPSPHSSPAKSNKSSPVKQLSTPVKEEKTDSSMIEPPSSPAVVMENIPVIRRESSRFKESGGSSSDTPPPIIQPFRKRRQKRQEIVLTPIPQEEETEEYRSVFQQEKEINDFILNEFSSPFTCDNSFQEELDRTPPSKKGRKGGTSSSVDKDFDFSYFSSSHYSLVDLVTDSDSINFSKFYMNPRAGISRNYNVRRNNSAVPGGLFMVGKKRKNNRTGWPNKKKTTANNRRCKVFTFNNRLKKIIPGLVDEATNASTVTTASTVDSVSAEKFETPCPTPLDLEDTEFNVSSDSLDGSTTLDERPPSSVAEKRRLKVPTVRLRRFKR
ncbi:DBF4 family protein [Megaselia abdita]